MTAKSLFGPVRLEAGSGPTTYYLPPLSGQGALKDLLFFVKVFEKSSNNPVVRLDVKHGADADGNFVADHSTPIDETVTSAPVLLTGQTDVATNGPIGEWVHLELIVGGGAGRWAVAEVFYVPKVI